MKLTGWTDWSNEDYIDAADDTDSETYKAIEKAVIEGIRENGVQFTGGYHQTGDFGCPVVDEKYILRCSFRGWGYIMAEALKLPNEDGTAYCQWAWRTPSGKTPVYPGALE